MFSSEDRPAEEKKPIASRLQGAVSRADDLRQSAEKLGKLAKKLGKIGKSAGKSSGTISSLVSAIFLVLKVQLIAYCLMVAAFIVGEHPVLGWLVKLVASDILIIFFVLGWIVVLAIGLLLMLVVAIFLIMSNMRPFSGKGAWVKHCLFLISLIGYSVPFLGLFPWLIPWTIYVILNPE